MQLNSAELLKTGEVGRAGGSRCRCGQGIGGGGNFYSSRWQVAGCSTLHAEHETSAWQRHWLLSEWGGDTLLCSSEYERKCFTFCPHEFFFPNHGQTNATFGPSGKLFPLRSGPYPQESNLCRSALAFFDIFIYLFYPEEESAFNIDGVITT